jgi:hypothetical protein
MPRYLRLKFDDISRRRARPHYNALARIRHQRLSVENATCLRTKDDASVPLMLIVAVAAFNIVAALVMVVNEKRNDIDPPHRRYDVAVGVFFTQVS